MNERISIDSKICHGQACIKGTRIPVYQIIRMLANSDKIEDLLEDYPSLKADDIYACLDYAVLLAEEQITPLSIKKWPSFMLSCFLDPGYGSDGFRKLLRKDPSIQNRESILFSFKSKTPGI